MYDMPFERAGWMRVDPLAAYSACGSGWKFRRPPAGAVAGLDIVVRACDKAVHAYAHEPVELDDESELRDPG